MDSSSTIERKVVQIRGIAFFLVLGILFLTLIGNFAMDYLLLNIMKISQIPLWYIILLFGINILTVLSLIGIWFFRKFGIWLFPFFVMLHFIIYLNYMDIFKYTDVFMLFFFVGIGLVVFIPKWKFFKQ